MKPTTQGHGAFSVPPSIKIPPSLRNIYKELYNDTNVSEFNSNSIPTHGNLTRWAKQGVLLLNNVWTVRRGEAASHSKRGWEEFTDAVIEAVLKRDDDVSVDGYCR
jgi:uracil-DNA glycosylase